MSAGSAAWLVVQKHSRSGFAQLVKHSSTLAETSGAETRCPPRRAPPSGSTRSLFRAGHDPSRQRPRPSAESCPGCPDPAARPAPPPEVANRLVVRAYAPRSSRAARPAPRPAAASRWSDGVARIRLRHQQNFGFLPAGPRPPAGRRLLARQTRSVRAGRAQRLFEQIRPFDSGQSMRRPGREGRAPGAVPSGARSAYSVQCEQASWGTVVPLSRFYAVLPGVGAASSLQRRSTCTTAGAVIVSVFTASFIREPR